MTAELGQVTLLIALLTAIILGIFPMIGAYNGNRNLMAMATRGAVVQAALLAGAFALLTRAFVVQDFSVEYVALNSNSLLPLKYRFSAVWGAQTASSPSVSSSRATARSAASPSTRQVRPVACVLRINFHNWPRIRLRHIL